MKFTCWMIFNKDGNPREGTNVFTRTDFGEYLAWHFLVRVTENEWNTPNDMDKWIERKKSEGYTAREVECVVKEMA